MHTQGTIGTVQNLFVGQRMISGNLCQAAATALLT